MRPSSTVLKWSRGRPGFGRPKANFKTNLTPLDWETGKKWHNGHEFSSRTRSNCWLYTLQSVSIKAHTYLSKHSIEAFYPIILVDCPFVLLSYHLDRFEKAPKWALFRPILTSETITKEAWGSSSSLEYNQEQLKPHELAKSCVQLDAMQRNLRPNQDQALTDGAMK